MAQKGAHPIAEGETTGVVTKRRVGAVGVTALALCTGLGNLVLLAVESWPFTNWATGVFALWIALPAWLFHMTARVADRGDVLALPYMVIAPLALIGGLVSVAHGVWARGGDALPMAFIGAPLAQLAVVMPFLLMTGTDKQRGSVPQER